MDRKNMLDFWMEVCADEIYSLKEEDYKFMRKKTKTSVTYYELMDYVQTLPLQEDIKNKLIIMLDNAEGVESSQYGYFIEKYYKKGFSDAVNLIFDAKEYKK